LRESAQEIADLQRLLDRSYESAGEHLRSIITPERRLSAEEVCGELQGMTLLALATVSLSGRPYVSPVDGVFYRGAFWFGSSETSLRFRHIRARLDVSATHTRGEDLVVTVHGVAHEIDKQAGDFEGLEEVFREIYGSDWDSWGYWESAPYAWIEPRAMFAARFRQV
jgi:hypothetical protein